MPSVTQRIKALYSVPNHRVYIDPRVFKPTYFDDGIKLMDQSEENVEPAIVGLAVDYLTRFMTNSGKNEAFKISLIGAAVREQNLSDGSLDSCNRLINSIRGLDDESIVSACKLVGFDAYFRARVAKDVSLINPDKDTINNIRNMVERSVRFFMEHGPVVMDGFSFDFGTLRPKYVHSGDGDFLTKDTLWDFKVSKRTIDEYSALQLLVYYILGIKNGKEVFRGIKRIAVYNPRLNAMFHCDVRSISKETMDSVKTEVIGI